MKEHDSIHIDLSEELEVEEKKAAKVLENSLSDLLGENFFTKTRLTTIEKLVRMKSDSKSYVDGAIELAGKFIREKKEAEDDKKKLRIPYKDKRAEAMKRRLKNIGLKSVTENRHYDPELEFQKAQESRAAYKKVMAIVEEAGGIKKFFKMMNDARNERYGPLQRLKWHFSDESFVDRLNFNVLTDEEKKELIGIGNYVVGKIEKEKEMIGEENE